METASLRWLPGSGWSGPLPGFLDSPRTLVTVWGPSGWESVESPLREVLDTFPNSAIIGCSTAGEILGDTIADGSVTVAVLRFKSVDVRLASRPVREPAESAETAAGLARDLAGPDLRGVFALSDGLRVNGSLLASGFNRALPPGVVVTGGLAADDDRFQRTWVMAGGLPQEGIVAAAGLYGAALRVGHGSRGGWDIFGPERVITASRDNVLFELDGRPALGLYKEYLGDLAAGLPGTALLFPLAVRTDWSDEVVVRTILGVDEVHNALTFAGDVPRGAIAQLMRANFDRLVDASAAAAAGALPAENGPVACFAVSCVGRRLILGERTEEELEASLDALPAGALQVGFYSYGELSPLATGACDLHNQTMTVTTFAEAA